MKNLSFEQYKTIFNEIPASLIIIDVEGKIIDINQYHVKHVNNERISQKGYIGRIFFELPTIIKSGISDEYKKVLNGNSINLTSVLFLEAGMFEGYFNIKGVPLYEGENIIGAIFIHEDISKIEEAKQNKKEILKLLYAQKNKFKRQAEEFQEKNNEYYTLNEEFQSQNEELRTTINEVSQINKQLAENKKSYHNLFEHNPISLWEEDLSEVKKLLEAKKKTGITDFKEFFNENPDFVFLCASKIKILNINSATLKLLKAPSKEYLIKNMNKVFNEKAIETFKQNLLYIIEKRKEFYTETEHIRFDGKTIQVAIKSIILEDFDKIIIAIIDITELKTQNKELKILTKELLKKNKLIAESEHQYRVLFEENPISLWDEDITEITKLIRKKQQEGIIDFKTFFNDNPDFVLECISKLKIININEKTLDLLKVPSKEFLLKNFHKLFNHTANKNFIQTLYLIAYKKKFFYAETEHIRFDGELRTIILQINVIENYKKAIVSVIDITEQKNAKKQLEESKQALKNNEQKLESILNTSPIAITTTDLRGKITYVSEQTIKLHGYNTKEELLGKNSLILIASEDKKKAIDNLKKTIKGETIKNIQSKFLKKDGTIFDAEISATRIKDNDTLIATTKDITQRLQQERELAESEHRFKTLYENIPSGMLIVSQDYIIKDVNRRTCEITGYKREELVGQLCDIICPKGSKSKECPIWEEGYKSIQGMDTTIKCSDGRQNSIIKNAKTIILEGKQYILENFQDINDLKQAEEEIIQKNSELILAKEKAEESNRLKTAFLANMSHEIRTPMNGIVGFADLLNEDNLSKEKRDEYIQIIKSSSNQLLDIVNDLIDISKIEIGEIEISKNQTSINNILSDLFSVYKPITKGNNVILNLSHKLPENYNSVFTDEIKLFQILNNIISNAIKFTHKGTIDFGCVKQGDLLQFFIKDTGIGIAKKYWKTIFERFGQAKTNAKQLYRGTGLGLSIAKAYTKKLGGKIWLESELGKGTIFHFTIPYEIADKNIEPKVKMNNKIKMNNNYIQNMNLTILVVEDEYVNYLILEKMLSKINIKTINAQDGREAINFIKNNPEISLVFLDIKLPDMTGYEVVKVIKSIRKELPVIAQTAYAMSGDREKTIKEGFDDYLSKPIIKDKLYEIVRKWKNKNN